MKFPDLDQQRLGKIESDYNIKCLGTLPFSPTEQVRWQCNSQKHEWTVSAIEVQIDQGCFQCSPQNIKLQGNGAFAQSMATTMATLVRDFETGQFRNYAYLPDAALHLTLASFFFTAVRTEFVLKAMSDQTPGLGLNDPANNREFKVPELIDRMFKLASGNIVQFKIPHLPQATALQQYIDLKKSVESYVIARNKIGHGNSKYPTTHSGNYNASISDLIRSFGQDGLDRAYANSSKFLSISETLLDTSPDGIKLGNRILFDLFRS